MSSLEKTEFEMAVNTGKLFVKALGNTLPTEGKRIALYEILKIECYDLMCEANIQREIKASNRKKDVE